MNLKNLLKNNKLLIFIAISIVLFVTIALVTTRQDFRQRAAGAPIAKLVFNPQNFQTSTNSSPTHLSVLAYDANNNPIFNGVTYSWGISSTNTVGTLTAHSGTVSSFVPKNEGTGDIYVTAVNEVGSTTGSTKVTVGQGTLTPTPVTNPFGKSLRIQSQSSGLRITNPNKSLLQNGFTIDVWFRKGIDAFPSGSSYAPFVFSVENLLFVVSSGSQAQNRVIIQSSLPLSFINGPTIEHGAWHHAAITFLPTSSTKGIMALHLDGKTYINNDMTNPLFDPTINVWTLGGGSNSYFDGEIDEFHIRKGIHYSQTASTYTPPALPFILSSDSLLLAHFDGNYSDLTGRFNIQTSSGISFVDSTIPVSSITPTIPTSKTGDINGDGQVGSLDLSILLSNWGLSNPSDPDADINKSGRVDITDLSILLSNWEK